MKTQFHDIKCNITKVFLHGVMHACLKKTGTGDFTQARRDKRSSSRLISNRNYQERKSQQMLTVISCLHALQSNGKRGFGSLKVIRILLLYLDKKGGASESVLKELSASGLTISPKYLREILHKVAENVDPNAIRDRFNLHNASHVPVLLFTFDIVDYKHYSRVVSTIVAGTVQMGVESKEDNDELNEHYIQGLPIPNEEDANSVKATKDDDVIALHGIHRQNIAALYNAFLCRILAEVKKSVAEGQVRSNGNNVSTIIVGTNVQFSMNRDVFVGTVIEVKNDSSTCTVSYRERIDTFDEIDIEMKNLIVLLENDPRLDDTTDRIQSTPSAEDSATNQTVPENDPQLDDTTDRIQPSTSAETTATDLTVSLSNSSDSLLVDGADDFITTPLTASTSSSMTLTHTEEAKRINEFVSGRDDGGRRQKIDPCLTVITDLLSGVSSKHAEATRTVMDRQMQKDPKFHEKVHNISTDQEFITSLFSQLFMSHHSSARQNKKPYVIGVAWGHLHKNIVMSMFKYYSCILDELFRVKGVKVGGPAYNRIVKGRNIKASIKWMVNAIETLRMAQAKEYLDQVGDDCCIDVSKVEKKSPNLIIAEALCDKHLFPSNQKPEHIPAHFQIE